jgi:microcystin-dependent protein
MPTFTVANSFTPFTKIRSADVNTNFTGIATFLNTTKIDYLNIQDSGVTGIKIAAAAAGDGLTKDGSGNFAVSVDNSTIEISSDSIRVKDAGITPAKLSTSIGQGLVPAGTILPYGGTTAPSGYLLCRGQRVSRTTYADLLTAIGTAFGTGDGSTTFNVPDMRGMFARGYNDVYEITFAPADVNTGVGVETLTLTNHGINRSGYRIRFNSSGGLPAPLAASTNYYAIYVDANTIKVATTEANALAGTAIDLTTQGTGTHTLYGYVDPDAYLRTAPAPGGATVNNVGAVQGDEVTAHTHSFSTQDSGTTNNGTTGKGNTANTVAGATGSTGGAETRPRNIVLNYIIKF